MYYTAVNSWLEQESLIKYLVAEKCKQCEIYERMFDVYEAACFTPNIVRKSSKHGRPTTRLRQKDSSWSGNTVTFRQRKYSGHRGL